MADVKKQVITIIFKTKVRFFFWLWSKKKKLFSHRRSAEFVQS